MIPIGIGILALIVYIGYRHFSKPASRSEVITEAEERLKDAQNTKTAQDIDIETQSILDEINAIESGEENV